MRYCFLAARGEGTQYEHARRQSERIRVRDAITTFCKGGGTLPLVVEPWIASLRVQEADVDSTGVRCGAVWVVETELEGTRVRVESLRVDPAEVSLTN
jgi:hypothetical protein